MEHTSKFLVYGGNGFIGSGIVDALTLKGFNFTLGKARLPNMPDIKQEIDAILPTHLICAAGLKGTPNIDWFDLPENKEEGYQVNVVAQVEIAKLCAERNIHCVLVGSGGAFYTYDEAHAIGGAGFTETDAPNYTANVYAQLRITLEQQLESLVKQNTLYLRFNVPVSSRASPANLLTKIVGFPKVHDVPQSMTYLDDMCPLLIDMCTKKTTGIFNFTSPGCISPHQILTLYKAIAPNHQWEQSGPPTNRPSCFLDTSKLEELFPNQRLPISEAVKQVFSKSEVK